MVFYLWYLHFICILTVLEFTVNAADSKRNLLHTDVLKDAQHYWTFDIFGNLFWISDKKTNIASKARGNGARLIQASHIQGLNFLRLKGYGTRLELGEFPDCTGDVKLCTRGFTVSMWLRFRDIQTKDQYLMGNMDLKKGTRYGYALTRTANNLMNISISMASHRIFALYPAQERHWQHHVITINSGYDINVYQNSIKAMRNRGRRSMEIHENTRRRDKREVPENNVLSLGKKDFEIDADYDEVATWDRVLTDAEVKAMYKSGLSAPVINKDCRSNASSICISWPKIYDPYERILKIYTYYKVYTVERKAFHQKPVPNKKSAICIGNLEPVTKYSIGVYIKLRNTESMISKMTVCQTVDGVPFAPDELSGAGVSSTVIQITWKTPRPPNGKIWYYQLILRKPSSFKVIARYNVTTLHLFETYSLNITHLTPSTLYRVEIESVGKLGSSGRASVVIPTLSPVPTSPVSGLAATKISWNSIHLSWKPMPVIANTVYTYELTYKESGKETKTILTKDNTAIINDLKQLSSYLVNIKAGTSSGFGPGLIEDLYIRTKDRDECKDNWANLCDINAKCYNTEGSYLCQCTEGYYGNGITCRTMPVDTRMNNFCPEEWFRNILWPKTYQGMTAVEKCPKGTEGFATRRCLPGLTNSQAAFALADLTQCISKEVENIVQLVDNPSVSPLMVVKSMKNVTKEGAVMYGGDVKKMVGFFDTILVKKINSSTLSKKTARDITKNVAEVANNLLADNMLKSWDDIPVFPEDARTKSASILFDSLEGFAGVVSESLTGQEKYKIALQNLEIMVQGIPNVDAETVAKYENVEGDLSEAANGTPGKSIRIAIGSLKNKQGRSNFSMSFLSFNNAEDLLRPSRNRSHHLDRRKTKLIVNSGIISASIVGVENAVFDEPVQIVLPHLQEKAETINTSCVFWSQSNTGGGDWSTTGCWVNTTNASHTVCYCNHLTNFAVLMTVSGAPPQQTSAKHQLALRIITYIGLLISLLALFLAIFAFTCFRFLKSARTIYHRHLIVALIFAHLLFLVGIERTEIKLACTLIAVLLHYFFLVAFVWMGMEGVLLYFMLTKIFNNRKLVKRKLFYVLCWLLPALYVAILASIFTPYYGTEHLCWLSAKDGFSWAFVGPVLFVICMNLGFMVRAFKVMAEKRKGPEDFAHEAWYWLKGCLVLTCVLGVTWIVGLFYVDSNTLAFAYIFNILNALQGLFIFIFHCIIDSRVRSEFVRILKCQARHEYNEKAGYSSSMRFRNWSSTMKSNGSLDRSTISRSGHKRLNSDSTNDSVNAKVDADARRPSLLKAVPEIEEEKPKLNGRIPEKEPLLQAAAIMESEEEPSFRAESLSSDGDVFIDDIEIATVENKLIETDNERPSPVSDQLGRMSGSSNVTLDDVVEILEGRSPSVETESNPLVESTHSLNDVFLPEEPSVRKPSYDELERSMEELVLSLEEEEEKIESEDSFDTNRLAIVVEADASSIRSSLSAEITMSEEEEEEEIQSPPGSPFCPNPVGSLEVSPDNIQSRENSIDSDNDSTCVSNPETIPNSEKCDQFPPLERPNDNYPKHFEDEVKPEHTHRQPVDKDEVLILVQLQIEQKPCFAQVTYPSMETGPKSTYGRTNASTSLSDTDHSNCVFEPEVLMPNGVR